MIQVNEPTEEQTNKENSRQADLHKSLTDTLKGDKIQDAILQDLGLSPDADTKKVVKKSIQEEEQEESLDSEVNEDESLEDDSIEQEEDMEEVVPKSKVQKRIDELTAKNKHMEQKLRELEALKEEPKDDITKQLEAMSPLELKAAKMEVRKAQIRAQGDDAKLNELLELEDKIVSVMENAPKTFLNNQIDIGKKAYIEVASQFEESQVKNILAAAKEIYDSEPLFQKDINGQAAAIKLAAKHFKAINSAPGDRTKESELKRQVNSLKRKTTLDTKTGQVNSDKVKLDAMRTKAIGGTYQNKVDLVRTHPMFNVEKMIPDELKNRG